MTAGGGDPLGVRCDPVQVERLVGGTDVRGVADECHRPGCGVERRLNGLGFEPAGWRFLNGDDVGLEGLEDADAGCFISLAGGIGQVGRDNGEGNRVASRRTEAGGSREQADEKMEQATHAKTTIP